MKLTHATNVTPSQNPLLARTPPPRLGTWPAHEDHRVASGG